MKIISSKSFFIIAVFALASWILWNGNLNDNRVDLSAGRKPSQIKKPIHTAQPARDRTPQRSASSALHPASVNSPEINAIFKDFFKPNPRDITLNDCIQKMRSLGIHETQTTEGNKETGERVILKGENAAKGILALEITFLTDPGVEPAFHRSSLLTSKNDTWKQNNFEFVRTRMGREWTPTNFRNENLMWENKLGWIFWMYENPDEDTFEFALESDPHG